MQHFISSFWSWEAKGLALINSSGSGKASQGNVEGHFPYTKYIYLTIVKASIYLYFNVMDYCTKPMSRGHVGQLYVYFKIVRTGRQETQIVLISTFDKFNVDLVKSQCPALI